MLIYIAMPTEGVARNGVIHPHVLGALAQLHLRCNEHTFIAPMVQGYQLLAHMPQSTATWAEWGRGCRVIIERCDEVWVLMYTGWDTSVGVASEVAHARLYQKPVVYFKEADLV